MTCFSRLNLLENLVEWITNWNWTQTLMISWVWRKIKPNLRINPTFIFFCCLFSKRSIDRKKEEKKLSWRRIKINSSFLLFYESVALVDFFFFFSRFFFSEKLFSLKYFQSFSFSYPLSSCLFIIYIYANDGIVHCFFFLNKILSQKVIRDVSSKMKI